MNTTISEELYECRGDGCEERFKHRSQRIRHEETCSKPITITKEYSALESVDKYEDAYMCKSCNKVITQRNNIHRHLKKCRGHIKKDSHRCNNCQQEFPFKSLLDRHQLTHTKQNYSCANCSKEYKRKDKYEKHVSSCIEFANTSSILIFYHHL